MIHRLHYKSHLNIDLDTAWDFFSNPENLNSLTPQDMNFKILSGADRPMYSGQIIIYKVSPFPYYTTTWVTEISHVIPKKMFVDEQRFGPYAFWYHQHIFNETKEGLQTEDIVHYKLPYGFLGQAAHKLFVKNMLKQIFDFRQKRLTELFK